MTEIKYPGIGGTATLFTTGVDIALGGGVKVAGTPATPEQLAALERIMAPTGVMPLLPWKRSTDD